MLTDKAHIIRPTWVEIDRAALRANLRGIKALVGPDCRVMAVVKAEAYGHGAAQVAELARAEGIEWFGVALPEEGIALRQAGVDGNILVFAPFLPEQAATYFNYDLVPTITNWESAAALSAEALRRHQKARAHIKVDTGMGRIGFLAAKGAAAIERIFSLPGLTVEGIYSHFATADAADLTYARQQLGAFRRVVEELESKGLNIPLKHIANSGGILNLPESYFDMVRAGLILYGMWPSPWCAQGKIVLKPAFSLKTKVVFVKRVPAGSGISYGQCYHTSKETTIATLPIGYADGWLRALSGKARVLINGEDYPVVGTICMDQCMVDVGDAPVQVGDEVVLIGEQKGKAITVEEVADHLNTINYEVVCQISSRVPRIYV
ncbi:MAG TPA: alanine racemase [Firmicutes bacterium]|nr:alanine racemase [Bacillota bacterium]